MIKVLTVIPRCVEEFSKTTNVYKTKDPYTRTHIHDIAKRDEGNYLHLFYTVPYI